MLVIQNEVTIGHRCPGQRLPEDFVNGFRQEPPAIEFQENPKYHAVAFQELGIHMLGQVLSAHGLILENSTNNQINRKTGVKVRR